MSALFSRKKLLLKLLIIKVIGTEIPILRSPSLSAPDKQLSSDIDNYHCYSHNYVRMVAPDEDRVIGRSRWTVGELIATAERIISSDPKLFAHPKSESNKELNVRLIRDYVVREFIPRPERLGREARFGLDHLVQLLALRVLLRSQKWSLPAIKASFTTTRTEELLNGLLAPVRSLIEAEYRKATAAVQSRAQIAADGVRTPALNSAQLLIDQFKATKQPQARPLGMPLFNKIVRATPSDARPATQPTGGASSKLHVQLEPWCEVVIDAERAKTLTPEEVERLGEALKGRLHDEAAR